MGALDFVSAIGRPVATVSQFLKEAADNGIRYGAEKNTRHQLYIPFILVGDSMETAVKQLQGLSASTHSIIPEPGKGDSAVCVAGKTALGENGELLLDGNCPYCQRVSSAWALRNSYLEFEKEKLPAGLNPVESEKQLKDLKSKTSSDRIVKEAVSYIYLVIVKFKTQEVNGKLAPVIGEDKLPEYEIKVARWSANRIGKIKETLDSSGIEMEGAEIVIKYADEDDKRLQVSQSTISPVFGNNMFTAAYPGLVAKIDAEVSKWSWAGIENSFKELNVYPNATSEAKLNKMFHKWDAYVAEFGDDGKGYAKYEASLSRGAAPNIPVSTGSIPMNAPENGVQAPQMPQMGQGVQMGAGIAMDPNAAFANAGTPGLQ